MKKIIDMNPFNVEKQRANYALKKNYKSLIATYTSKFPEIPDKNTSEMWSELNKIAIKDYKNPMAWDRVHKTVKLISEIDGKLLDIGFGSGIIENLLTKSKSKIQIFGIDIARVSVETAKRKYPMGKFKVGSILKLPYTKSEFDYVLALEVLEHIQPHNTFKALSEVYRVLKPNGYFIISVPLNEGLEQLVNESRNLNAHVRVYTPALVKAELQISGFKVLKEKYLFAFHDYYHLKSLIAMLFIKKYKPNNLIILCQKT